MTSWYCKIDDVEHGPLSQGELVKMVQQGRLSLDDLVRTESKEKWYKARDVKGLDFPTEDEPPSRAAAKKEKDASPASTSSQADSLLKSLTKKGSGQGEDIEVDSWEQKERSSSKSMMTKTLDRKPLDPRLKKIAWICGGVILLLVLFPPHQPPDGVTVNGGLHWRFLFMPPVVPMDIEKHGTGAIDPNSEIIFEGDKAIIKAAMGIDWLWLSLECLGVIAIGGTVGGIMLAKSAAADIHDVKPGKPPSPRTV